MIGIVGAGISGLALGAFLQERDVDHRIFEASERPGGVIRTSVADGRILEHGPQRIRLAPAVERLVAMADLENELVRVPEGLPLFVLRGGRLRPVPTRPAEFLGTDLLSVRGKARVLLEPLARGPLPDETVEGFLVRRFGTEAYRAFLGPLFGGIFAQDPADMYARHALEPLLRSLGAPRSLLVRALARSALGEPLPRAASFRMGMAALTDRLHERLAARTELRTPVQEVRRDHGRDGAWRIVTSTGELRCDRVVLTVPADEAARILAGAVPELAARLARLRYNPLALVHLLSAGSPRGLGYQVAFGEALRTRGVTWNASALGRDGIHTAFLGGSHDPGIVDLPDEQIGQIASEEFRRVTGHAAKVIAVSRTRVPSWDRSWAALDGVVLPPGLHLASNYRSRVGIPGRVAEAEALAEELAGR